MTPNRPMRRNEDLHPDDATARTAIIAKLADLRILHGVSRPEAARRAGCTLNALRIFETRHPRNPRVNILQRHCRPVHHLLTFTLHDLPDVSSNPAVAMWRSLAATAADPDDADRYDREAAIAAIAAARTALGVAQVELSHRIGAHFSAICQIERHVKDPQVGTWQKLARGLGGWLGFELQPIAVDVVA